jgi:hypothetical protein
MFLKATRMKPFFALLACLRQFGISYYSGAWFLPLLFFELLILFSIWPWLSSSFQSLLRATTPCLLLGLSEHKQKVVMVIPGQEEENSLA